MRVEDQKNRNGVKFMSAHELYVSPFELHVYQINTLTAPLSH